MKKRNGGGHVGFVVGRDQNGKLMVLGGNQNNRVSIAPFDEDDFVAFRWPSVYPSEIRFLLPLLRSTASPSRRHDAEGRQGCS